MLARCCCSNVQLSWWSHTASDGSTVTRIGSKRFQILSSNSNSRVPSWLRNSKAWRSVYLVFVLVKILCRNFNNIPKSQKLITLLSFFLVFMYFLLKDVDRYRMITNKDYYMRRIKHLYHIKEMGSVGFYSTKKYKTIETHPPQL